MKTSVLIATHNGGKYIEYLLRSVIEQSEKVDEILISDDKSKDDSFSIIQNFFEKSQHNAKIFSQNVRLGVNKNFEFLLRKATGDIIFFCDQDDVWRNDKVFLYKNKFINESRCVALFSNSQILEKKEKFWDVVAFKKKKKRLWKVEPLKILSKQNIVQGATLAIRKEVIPYVVPIFDAGRFPNFYYDYWIVLRISLKRLGNINYVENVTMDYRIHNSQLTNIESLKKFSYKIDTILNKTYLVNIHNQLRIMEHIIRETELMNKEDFLELIKYYNNLINPRFTELYHKSKFCSNYYKELLLKIGYYLYKIRK